MLLDQPFAGAAQSKAGAVHEQADPARCLIVPDACNVSARRVKWSGHSEIHTKQANDRSDQARQLHPVRPSADFASVGGPSNAFLPGFLRRLTDEALSAAMRDRGKHPFGER
jgi:hypothetical protein